jgi:acetyl esterase/lipase
MIYSYTIKHYEVANAQSTQINILSLDGLALGGDSAGANLALSAA